MSSYAYVRPFNTAPVAGPTIVATEGDSILRGARAILPSGFAYEGGYRTPGFAGMTTEGMDPDFRGSLLNSSETPPVTTAGLSHGGYNGTTTAQWIASVFATWKAALDAIPIAPHVITIATGNNDADTVEAAQGVGTLIDMTAAAYPRAAMLVGTRTPLFPQVTFGATHRAQVLVEVATRRAFGMHVTLVDFWTALGSDPGPYLSDGQHPNAAGYALMGAMWLRALVALKNGVGN